MQDECNSLAQILKNEDNIEQIMRCTKRAWIQWRHKHQNNFRGQRGKKNILGARKVKKNVHYRAEINFDTFVNCSGEDKLGQYFGRNAPSPVVLPLLGTA